MSRNTHTPLYLIVKYHDIKYIIFHVKIYRNLFNKMKKTFSVKYFYLYETSSISNLNFCELTEFLNTTSQSKNELLFAFFG